MVLGITGWQTIGSEIQILCSDIGIKQEGCIQQRFHKIQVWSLVIAEKNAQQEMIVQRDSKN